MYVLINVASMCFRFISLLTTPPWWVLWLWLDIAVISRRQVRLSRWFFLVSYRLIFPPGLNTPFSRTGLLARFLDGPTVRSVGHIGVGLW